MGCSLDELKTMNLKKIMQIHEQEWEEHLRRIGNEGMIALEFKIRVKPGQSLYVNVRAVLMENEKIYAAITDITKRKKQEIQSNIVNGELNGLIYQASHILEGPIATMSGLLQLAEKEVGDATSLEYLNRFSHCRKKLELSLTNLVAVSSIRLSHTCPQHLDFQGIFDEVTRELEPFFNCNEVDLRLSLIGAKAFYSDRGLIKIILRQLIQNAVEFRSKQVRSIIKVSITSVKGKMKIEVTDNGRGIPRQYQAEVFKMFFRAHEDAEGSGLGLYIAKHAVEKLGGEINLISAQNQGTTITITFNTNDSVKVKPQKLLSVR